MGRPLIFRSLKLRNFRRREQGPCLTVRHHCSGCQAYGWSVLSAVTMGAGGARDHRRGGCRGVSRLRGAVHVGQRVRDYFAEGYSVRPGSNPGAVEQNPLAVREGCRLGVWVGNVSVGCGQPAPVATGAALVEAVGDRAVGSREAPFSLDDHHRVAVDLPVDAVDVVVVQGDGHR